LIGFDALFAFSVHQSSLVPPNRLQQVHRIALLVKRLNALAVFSAEATPTQ
jgi:hypothetical protein